MQEIDSMTLRRAARGDRRAFKALYDRYAPFLWRVLFPMAGRDTVLAGEFLQDTFVRAYRSLGKFEEQSALSTWLYRIAYTTAMAHFRSNRRHPMEQLDEQLAGDDRSDSFDNSQLAKRILGSLAPDDRFLVVAREVHDISFEDLASVTGQASGALRTRLHRIKARIREQYPQEQFDAIGV